MTDSLDAITLRVRALVAELADLPPDGIAETAVVFGRAPNGDAGLLDSLDALKLGLELSAEYGLEIAPENDGREVYTVREIADYLCQHQNGQPERSG